MSLSGSLEKWTNYWLGWQTRYFKLENGILSYYQNEEEVTAGAKASIKIASCDIVTDLIDNRKFDVTVASGQRFSLRASSTSARQTWLVALGSAKQETDSRALLTKQSGDKAEKLTRKSTELRLYCDLLVQQVGTIQKSVESAKTDEHEVNLNENAVLLNATCKTFLKTLKDTMSLINDNIKTHNVVNNTTGFHENVPLSPKLKSKLKRTPSTSSLPIGLGQNQENKKSHKRTNSNISQFSTGSLDFHTGTTETRSLHSFKGAINESDFESEKDSRDFSHEKDSEKDVFSIASADISGEIADIDRNEQEMTPNMAVPLITGSQPIQPVSSCETIVPETEVQLETFFNVIKHSFESVQLERNSKCGTFEIPTEPFLLASGDFLPILDKLGSKAFQPVKMDISGNISKIRAKYETDPEKFSTLQSIVLFEKGTNTHNVSNSATDAIMWLKRGLTFVKEFLKNVANGEENLTKALQDAYTASLARHHGWVVRGVFHLALKAAPYYSDFVDALTGRKNSTEDSNLMKSLIASINIYYSSLENILAILDQFYLYHNLESSKLI